MMKHYLTGLIALIILVVAVGCNKGGSDATENRSPAAVPPPATSAPAGETEEPAATAEAAEGGEVAGEEAAPAAEGESAPGGGEEAAPAGEEAAPAGDEESAPESEATEAPAEGKSVEAAAEEESAVEAEEPAESAEAEPVEDEATADEQMEDEANVAADVLEEGAEEPAEEAVDEPVDPIDQFKALDPREIIDRKYTDLQEQHTTPWDEEDPEQFIPDTGRIDPLTPVRDAVPEELKAPRVGDEDANEILSYTIARDATLAAYQIAYNIQCMNIIQIGIDKQATLSVFGNPYTMSEGETAGPFQIGVTSGIPLVATLECESISESEVVVIVTVAGEGTTTSISKKQTFIPKTWM